MPSRSVWNMTIAGFVAAALSCPAAVRAQVSNPKPKAGQPAAAPEPPPPPVKKKLPHTQVDVSPNFTHGDSVVLDWRRTTVIPGAKGKLQADTMSGTVKVEVLSASPDEFVFGWTWGTVGYNSQGRVGVCEAEVVAALLSGQRIEFAISRGGELRGLRSYASLRSRLRARLEEVIDARRPPLGENPVVEQLRTDLLEAVSSEDSASELVLQDPVTLFSCLVGPLMAGDQTRAESQLPNPFGGEPFPAMANIAVIDLTATTATIGWTVSLKQDQVAQVMAETVRKMQVRAGRKRPVPKVLSFGARSEGEVVVTLGSTWPIEGKHTYTLSNEGARETTTTVWKVRPEGRSPASGPR